MKTENGILTEIDFGSENLVFPKDMTGIDQPCFKSVFLLRNIESISVESGNPFYEAVDNCLIDKREKMLVLGCKNSKIPDDGSVVSIGLRAFFECPEELYIPDSIKNIGDLAFKDCAVRKIFIPKTVEHIGFGALCGYNMLEKIEVESGNPYYESTGNCLIDKRSKKLIACCDGSIIPEGVKCAGRLSLMLASDEKTFSVTFPKSLEKIETNNEFPKKIEFPIRFLVPDNSYALKFAEKCGLDYKII